MVLGTYKHYKGGIYQFLGTCEHTETNEKLAIYIDSNGKTWVRPSDMFHGWLDVDGEIVKRFTLINIGGVFDENPNV